MQALAYMILCHAQARVLIWILYCEYKIGDEGVNP